MKICGMCGRKILQSMIPFKIMIPAAMKAEPIDSCGQCFMLTRMNDMLQKIAHPTQDVKGGVQIGDPR